MWLLPAAWAQDATDLGGTATPPAFLVLGTDPDGVEAPSTPADVAVALGNIVPEGSPTLPTGIGLEVAPFWLGPTPVSVAQYVGGGPWTAWRNLRVSVVAQADGEAWTGAIGARTTIWGRAPRRSEAGRFVADYEKLVLAAPAERAAVAAAVESDCAKALVALGEIAVGVHDAMKGRREALDQAIEALEDQILGACHNPDLVGMGESAGWCREGGWGVGGGEKGPLPKVQDDELLAWLQARDAEIEAKNAELTALRQAALDQTVAPAEGEAPDPTRRAGCTALVNGPRRGLVVELGGAWGATSPDASFGALGPAAWSAYLLGAWFFGHPAIDMIGRVHGSGDAPTRWEWGGGLVWSWRKVDFGVSGLFGWELADSAWSVETVARFNYQVSPSLWLVTSFGAHLPFLAVEETSVLSQLSLHFNFGENRPSQAEMLLE